ncbi:unnamed protein product [Lampetra fluviatilis]
MAAQVALLLLLSMVLNTLSAQANGYHDDDDDPDPCARNPCRNGGACSHEHPPAYPEQTPEARPIVHPDAHPTEDAQPPPRHPEDAQPLKGQPHAPVAPPASQSPDEHADEHTDEHPDEHADEHTEAQTERYPQAPASPPERARAPAPSLPSSAPPPSSSSSPTAPAPPPVSPRRGGLFVCACAPGFHGHDCAEEEEKEEGAEKEAKKEERGEEEEGAEGAEGAGCRVAPCRNGASCTGAAGGFVCRCAPGFAGRRCEARTPLRALPRERSPSASVSEPRALDPGSRQQKQPRIDDAVPLELQARVLPLAAAAGGSALLLVLLVVAVGARRLGRIGAHAEESQLAGMAARGTAPLHRLRAIHLGRAQAALRRARFDRRAFQDGGDDDSTRDDKPLV